MSFIWEMSTQEFVDDIMLTFISLKFNLFLLVTSDLYHMKGLRSIRFYLRPGQDRNCWDMRDKFIYCALSDSFVNMVTLIGCSLTHF